MEALKFAGQLIALLIGLVVISIVVTVLAPTGLLW